MSKICKLSLFVAAMAVIVCGPVWAHSVVVFAWVEGETVFVEGKFASGRKAVNSTVEVYDPEENLLLKGMTDENGEFSFKVPGRTEMKVVLLAGMGHRGEWTIPVSDLESAGSAEERAVQANGAVSGSKISRPVDVVSNAVEPVATGSPRESSDYVSVAGMQAAIEAALDKKMKPMMKLLVEAKQEGPSVTDILGGIGYIFGLVGVAAYVAARKKDP